MYSQSQMQLKAICKKKKIENEFSQYISNFENDLT